MSIGTINNRAFYMPCGSHSLNLVVCDMTIIVLKQNHFFGASQCMYIVFSNSTKRRNVFLEYIDGLTLNHCQLQHEKSILEQSKQYYINLPKS